MLTLPQSVRIFLSAERADMRKGIDGLAQIVESWGVDIYSGHLFVFVSRRGDRLKILTWDTGGFVVYYKRLEKGRFRLPSIQPGATTLALTASELGMLLEGIDLSRVTRPRLWEPQRRAS